MTPIRFSLESLTLDEIWNKLLAVLPKAIAAILILAIGFWLASLIGKLFVRTMERRKIDQTVIPFLRSIVTIVFKFGVILSALAALGVNVNSFVAALGAAGITAGIGLQSSISQFASGIQILINKPFKSGDYIELEQFSGTVAEITLMQTKLHTIDNKLVVIPNSHVTSHALINYTAEEKRRLDLTFYIGYADNIVEAKKILKQLAEKNEFVLNIPAPLIAVKEQGQSGVGLIMQVWCDREHYWPLYYELQEKVKLAFDEAGVTIPYQTIDVRVIGEKSDNKQLV